MPRIWMTAVRVPIALGVNLTERVQLAPGASRDAHVFVRTKSPASSPAMSMAPMANGVAPRLVTTTVRAEPVVPTDWLPNESTEVDRLVADSALIESEMPSASLLLGGEADTFSCAAEVAAVPTTWLSDDATEAGRLLGDTTIPAAATPAVSELSCPSLRFNREGN